MRLHRFRWIMIAHPFGFDLHWFLVLLRHLVWIVKMCSTNICRGRTRFVEQNIINSNIPTRSDCLLLTWSFNRNSHSMLDFEALVSELGKLELTFVRTIRLVICGLSDFWFCWGEGKHVGVKYRRKPWKGCWGKSGQKGGLWRSKMVVKHFTNPEIHTS